MKQKLNKTDFFRRLDVLTEFSRKQNKSTFIDKCSDSTIHCLCELCFNVLRVEREIPLNKRTLKKLVPLKQVLRTLSDPRKSVSNKRRILNYFGPKLYPLITKSFLPALKRMKKKQQ